MFKNVLKLSLANLLGLLAVLACALVLMLVILLPVFGTVIFNFVNFLGADPQAPSEAPMEMAGMLGPGFLFLFLLVFFLLLLLAVVMQAFLVAGNFGSSISAVYDEVASVGSYFKSGGRHLWKMTLFVLLTSLLYFVLDFVTALMIMPFGETMNIIRSFLVLLIFVYVYCHAPLLIIRERMGIWKSINRSVQMITKNFSKTTMTVLWVVGTGLVYFGVFFVLGHIAGIPNPEELLIQGSDPSAPFPEEQFFSYMNEWNNFIQMMSVANLILFPIVMAVTHLIIVSRYKKHIEPVWFPKEPGSVPDDGSEPVFDIKKPE